MLALCRLSVTASPRSPSTAACRRQVTQHGQPVTGGGRHSKQPYELLVLGRRGPPPPGLAPPPAGGLLVSVPCAVHSRKPLLHGAWRNTGIGRRRESDRRYGGQTCAGHSTDARQPLLGRENVHRVSLTAPFGADTTTVGNLISLSAVCDWTVNCRF